jgi:hypothetical protein
LATVSRAPSARPASETSLSPLFKTPAEANRGSPLFLDLVDDARILVDRAVSDGIGDSERRRPHD